MQNERQNIPANACQFRASAFEFADGGDGDAENPAVRITARSGRPIEHWYWGKVTHDLSGMHMHKPTLTLDYCHNDEEVIGFLDQFDVDSGDLEVGGRLVRYREGDRASEVYHKSQAGVPYEASIYFGGEGIVIEEVSQGATTEVNGHDFDGPGVILRQWPLRGVAVCPYGADMHTQTEFNEGSEIPVTFVRNLSMSEDNKQKPAEDAAKLEQTETAGVEAVQSADAAIKEKPAELSEPDAAVHLVDVSKAECKRYLDAFGDIGAHWFADGVDFGVAQQKYIAKLKAERDELAAKLKAVDRGADEPAEFQSGENDTPEVKATQQTAVNVGENLAPLVALNASKLPARN